MLSERQGLLLLGLARQAIEEALGLPATAVPDERDLAEAVLQERRGVFVTLHKDGMLRGCIGCFGGGAPLVEAVRRQARNAAFHDHRFAPVVAEEVEKLRLSVSVLTEPQPLLFEESGELLQLLRVRVDGVILQGRFGESATFLPQVWEQLPTPSLFLAQLCRKAGLPENAWRTEPVKILTYQVQYFEEGR